MILYTYINDNMFVRASSGRRRFVPVHVGIDSESITRRPLTLRDVCTPRAVALPKDNLARRRGRGVFFSLVSLPRYDANARYYLTTSSVTNSKISATVIVVSVRLYEFFRFPILSPVLVRSGNTVRRLNYRGPKWILP